MSTHVGNANDTPVPTEGSALELENPFVLRLALARTNR